MYNDCPICGKYMTFCTIAPNKAIMSNCNHYGFSLKDDASLHEERFSIEPYYVYRGHYGIDIEGILYVNIILPLNKFNTVQKIERILLLS